MWSLTTWGGGRVFSLISNALIIHDHTTKGVITVKDTILLSDLTGHRWRDICFDRQPFMFQSVLSYQSRERERRERLAICVCGATLRCFDTVFQRPYRYFSIALKVFFSLSDRYKIFTSNWLWIEICENVVLSKIDITVTTINKKLWNW